jgi:hypothetical protein
MQNFTASPKDDTDLNLLQFAIGSRNWVGPCFSPAVGSVGKARNAAVAAHLNQKIIEQKCMEIRKLKLGRIGCLDSLKEQIMRSLKIYDHNKQCLPEFEDRFGEYLARNSKQVLEITLDASDIKKEMQRSLSPIRPFPPGYEMGNPLNRWMDGMVSMEPGEVEALRNRVEIEFAQFKEGVSEIVSARAC